MSKRQLVAGQPRAMKDVLAEAANDVRGGIPTCDDIAIRLANQVRAHGLATANVVQVDSVGHELRRKR